MKIMNKDAMKAINAGHTVYCQCGMKFKDIKFLWWTIYSGENQLKSHKKYCWTRAL